MRIPYFFACCRDMVKHRWECRLMPSGELHLCSKIELVCEDVSVFHPLCSVAKDVVGFRAQSEKDFIKAGKVLELPNEFTLLVFVASLRSSGLSGKILAVREELVECLRPQKLFEPLENSLHAPIISV